MVLGKLPVPWRPTLGKILGQGRCGWGSFDIFTPICLFSPLSLPFWSELSEILSRVKYCLKGLLNPKQPTSRSSRSTEMSTVKAGAQSSLQVNCIPCHL